MGVKCHVCGKLDYSHPELSFHRFPADAEKRKIWFSIIGFTEEQKLPKKPHICSDHFDRRHVLTRENGRRFLHPAALPQIRSSVFEDTSSSSSSSDSNDAWTFPLPSPSLGKSGLKTSKKNESSLSTDTDTYPEEQQNVKCMTAEAMENQETVPGPSGQQFPKDVEQRNLWFSILEIDDQGVSIKHPELCSDHFDPRNLIEKNGRKYVKPGALPELNPPIFRESSSSSSNSSASSPGSPTREIPNINDQQDIFEAGPSKLIVHEPNIGKLEASNENVEIFEAGPSKLIVHEPNIGKLEGSKENVEIFEAGPSKLIVHEPNIGKLETSNENVEILEAGPSKLILLNESIITIASSSSSTLTASEQGDDSEQEEIEEYFRDLARSKKRKRGYVGDLSSSDFATPEKRRKNVNLVKTEMCKKRRKIHSLQMTIRRMNIKIKSLQAQKQALIGHSESTIKVEEDDTLQSPTNQSTINNPMSNNDESDETEEKFTPYNQHIKEEIDKDECDSTDVQCLKRKKTTPQSGLKNEQGLEANGLHSPNVTGDIKTDESDNHGNVRLEESDIGVQNTVEDFPKDEWHYFGINVACQLRSLPFGRALVCQKKVIDMLTQERLEEYLNQMKSDGTETGKTE